MKRRGLVIEVPGSGPAQQRPARLPYTTLIESHDIRAAFLRRIVAPDKDVRIDAMIHHMSTETDVFLQEVAADTRALIRLREVRHQCVPEDLPDDLPPEAVDHMHRRHRTEVERCKYPPFVAEMFHQGFEGVGGTDWIAETIMQRRIAPAAGIGCHHIESNLGQRSDIAVENALSARPAVQ